MKVPINQVICPYDASDWFPALDANRSRHKERYPRIKGELPHKVQKRYE